MAEYIDTQASFALLLTVQPRIDAPRRRTRGALDVHGRVGASMGQACGLALIIGQLVPYKLPPA